MAKKLTFLGLAEKILRLENKPLSPSEVWKTAVAKGLDRQLEVTGKTPDKSLYTSMFLDARDNEDSIFFKIGERPARYFLKALRDGAGSYVNEPAAADDTPDIWDFSEADLHPFLAYYAHVYFKAHTKTIKHNASKKKEFGEWVHPDVIGVYYVFEEDWEESVLAVSAATGNMPVKLYSFELKKSLSFGNLREAFFQAVSNSSWAQEGYLVAADVSADEDFRAELRRLSVAFGIGVIQIDLDDPNSSEILFPASPKDRIDWDTLNKLAVMNTDVEELILRIRNDLNNKEVYQQKYDEIPPVADLVAKLKKKKPK